MAQISIERAIAAAGQHYQAGRLIETERIYRQILQQNPNDPGVLHCLGILLAQQRRYPEAEPILRRAISLRPDRAEICSDLANVLRDTGRLEEALALLVRAAELRPDLALVHSNLGNTLRDLGRAADAIQSHRRAISLAPMQAEFHCNLGNALCDGGSLADARLAYQRAIELNPRFPAALNNLGVVLQKLGQPQLAAAAFSRAIEIAPDYSEAYSNLGQSLELLNQPDQAIRCYRRAIELRPELPGAHCNLGNALLSQKKTDEAVAELLTAIDLHPSFPEAHNNLGNARCEQGDVEAAMKSYREALRLKPDYAGAISNIAAVMIDQGKLDEAEPLLRRALDFHRDFADAHWNLALLLLLRGDFLRGFSEYEWRWKVKEVMRGAREFPQPPWDGSDLHGQTILLHAEQGFGDAIQFARYVPLVAARGGRVVLQCPAPLVRLFQQLAPVVDSSQPPPRFDVHCPLLSLPLAMGTRLENIPADIPYLRADPYLAGQWGQRLSEDSGHRRIGLAWSGAAIHKNDRNRSTTLASFAPLAEIPGLIFYSLQKGVPPAPLPPPNMRFRDFTADLQDFADTAALIHNLDLVITVDTSVAHLAGAMGKKVWVILPSNPDWRWLLDRGDSPWYPTMKLFRQRRPGDWAHVLQHLAQELLAWNGV